MKYLVTFAYSQKTNIITGFEFDAYSERDYPIEKNINKINLHSINIENR